MMENNIMTNDNNARNSNICIDAINHDCANCEVPKAFGTCNHERYEEYLNNKKEETTMTLSEFLTSKEIEFIDDGFNLYMGSFDEPIPTDIPWDKYMNCNILNITGDPYDECIAVILKKEFDTSGAFSDPQKVTASDKPVEFASLYPTDESQGIPVGPSFFTLQEWRTNFPKTPLQYNHPNDDYAAYLNKFKNNVEFEIDYFAMHHCNDYSSKVINIPIYDFIQLPEVKLWLSQFNNELYIKYVNVITKEDLPADKVPFHSIVKRVYFDEKTTGKLVLYVELPTTVK